MGNSLILIGFKAAGKTTLAKKLAQVLGLPVCDLDELLKTKLGFSDIKTCYQALGEEQFRMHELAIIEELSYLEESMLIATGGGVVLNDKLMACLQLMGKILFLNTDYPEIEKRLFQDKDEINYLNQGVTRTGLKRIYEKRLPHYFAYADMMIGGE